MDQLYCWLKNNVWLELWGQQMLSRRAFLAGTSTVALNGVLSIWPFHPARAEMITTIVAAAALVSNVLNFMKKSGDLEREIEAVNLKLDQVLENQKFLLDAIASLNQSLERVQEALQGVPSETVSLQVVVELGALAVKTPDTLSWVKGDPTDENARRAYDDERTDIRSQSYTLLSAVRETSRQPSLAIGARHLLNAIRLHKRFDSYSGIADSKDPRLSHAAFNLVRVLEAMTSSSGILSANDELEQRIAGQVNAIRGLKSPYGSVLPDDLAERDDSLYAGEEPSLASTTSVCLMGPEVRTKLEEGFIGDFRSPRVWRHDVSEPAPDATIPYKRSTYQRPMVWPAVELWRGHAYGGRNVCYLSMRPEAEWDKRTWTHVVYREGGGRPVRSGDPKSDLDQCGEVSEVEKGAPSDFVALSNRLAILTGLIGKQSRLRALQDLALQDLETAKHIDQELSKKG